MMTFRRSALAVGGVLAIIGLIAFFRTDRTPELASAARSEAPAAAPGGSAPAAPAMDQAGAPGASPGMAGRPASSAAADDAPAITWSVPNGWQSIPNPNGMRIATYRVSSDSADGEGAEVSVSRAGGSTDANIQRWRGQFADAEQARRAQKTVRGLPVTLVDITGTYAAGPMMQGPSGAASHPGWELVAAIVETSATSYFFKMIGPAQKVRAARASFDALVDSLSPR